MASSFSFKETFTPIQSVQSLINLLGVKDTEKFEDLIRNGAESSYYIKPPIKKKNGGERIVYAPNKMLKSLLRKVNQKIFTQINYPDYLFGSIPDKENPRDYILCAEQHCKAKVLIKIDIENFFPTMREEYVYNIFNKLLKCSEEVAQILTKLTTFDGYVPQGAPTSTYLANLYFFDSEPKKVQHLRNNGFRYTRLIDDITVSRATKEGSWKYVESFIGEFITQKHLSINKDKTISRSSSSPQQFKVHSLSIEGEKPKFPRIERLKIKDHVHRVVKTGYGKDNERMKKSFHDLYFSVRGKITKLKRVDCSDYPIFKKMLKRHCDPLPDHKEIIRLNRVISNLSRDFNSLGESERYKNRYFKVMFRLSILKKLYPKETNEFKKRLKLISPEK
ncbi:reverse transcriptase family protein [Pantoea agglomerans]|uniref:reverse transcriptase family protein n=1 Tax=Enterobacter agglomerans TaxID=549 RepID=UPI00396593DE